MFLEFEKKRSFNNLLITGIKILQASRALLHGSQKSHFNVEAASIWPEVIFF